MRGKLSHLTVQLDIKRNIPAYAGKTSIKSAAIRQLKEHPRVCGENKFRRCRYHAARGTSPRMRGKLNRSMSCSCYLRNIPAYAGKTVDPNKQHTCIGEHPRVCGENIIMTAVESRVIGTSPRMRGKPRGPHHSRAPQRNIPAYAGKTVCFKPSMWAGREHPRVCGENSWVSW